MPARLTLPNRSSATLAGPGSTTKPSTLATRVAVAVFTTARLRAAREKAGNGGGIDPLSLLGALADTMPAEAIYVDETITHSPLIRQHLPHTMPQSFFRGSGGLGQGIGTALGIKLAARRQPVVLLIGDGSFLYNPIVQAVTIDGPDYEQLGGHFGFHGRRVEKREELPGALKGALAATNDGRTAILNVMVSR